MGTPLRQRASRPRGVRNFSNSHTAALRQARAAWLQSLRPHAWLPEASSAARRAEWTESACSRRPAPGSLVTASSFSKEAGNLDFYVKLLYF